MQPHAEEAEEENPDLLRYEALLEMADLMVHHGTTAGLLHELAARLHSVAVFEVATVSLHDASSDVMYVQTWEGGEPLSVPSEVGVEESASGWVWRHQEPLLLSDLRKETRFASILDKLRARGIRTYCMLPLTTSQNRLGALGFGSSQPEAYGTEDMEFLLRVAELVALALENVITREALVEEKQRLRTLVEVNRTLVSSLDLNKLLTSIASSVNRVVPHEFAGVALYDEEHNGMRAWVLASPEGRAVMAAEPSPTYLPFQLRQSKTFGREDLARLNSQFTQHVLQAGIQTMHSMPLKTSKGVLGTLNVGSTRKNAFSQADQSLLDQIAGQVAIALENVRAYHEIEQLKNRLAEEKLYLEDEIRSELGFEEIIGDSPALKRVLGQVKIVAVTDATVLILGETGTGKELIARAIHRMGKRSANSFIKLNCAAIPTGLLESELFGHEKGAFTGAINQKIGRLELADKGTLFLDEVGDIPLELQPKLLRVLQDQEFERLGSNKTIRVSVRLITATNQDLGKSVAERNFRSDLYYRLKVFPIQMPALRERRKDIPLLVRYFVQKFARRMNKQIETITSETMKSLMNWDWPGNVRELENFVERSVILTEGTLLRTPPVEPREECETGATVDTSFEGAEREHIIRILRETRGLISGPHGAAAKLGLKRTTLQSKMQKLGISREAYTRK